MFRKPTLLFRTKRHNDWSIRKGSRAEGKITREGSLHVDGEMARGWSLQQGRGGDRCRTESCLKGMGKEEKEKGVDVVWTSERRLNENKQVYKKNEDEDGNRKRKIKEWRVREIKRRWWTGEE